MKRCRWFAACLLALCTSCSADSILGRSATHDYASLFDAVWKTFDLHYSFFELKGIDWNEIGNRYRPLGAAARGDAQFASVVGKMLGELHDVHVSLTPFGAGSTIRYLSIFDTATTGYTSSTVSRSYLAATHTTNGKNITFGMVAADVGYLRIASFENGDWEHEVDEALAAMPLATRMIIDVRNNTGGSVTLAINTAGRFADKRRVYGYVKLRNGPAHTDFTDFIAETVEPRGSHRFSGNVFVLTNRRNFSSAEDFVLAMRALPNVRVVGDTTAGASGGPIVRELANGWTYQLSGWVEFTPDRRTFEGIGLPPDIVVKPANDDVRLGIDAVLARAILLASN